MISMLNILSILFSLAVAYLGFSNRQTLVGGRPTKFGLMLGGFITVAAACQVAIQTINDAEISRARQELKKIEDRVNEAFTGWVGLGIYNPDNSWRNKNFSYNDERTPSQFKPGDVVVVGNTDIRALFMRTGAPSNCWYEIDGSWKSKTKSSHVKEGEVVKIIDIVLVECSESDASDIWVKAVRLDGVAKYLPNK